MPGAYAAVRSPHSPQTAEGIKMMGVEIYPVLDGITVHLHGHCPDKGHTGQAHRGNGVTSTIAMDRLESMGVIAAIALELTLLLHENPDITHRAWC
jgi:hypothetical protein